MAAVSFAEIWSGRTANWSELAVRTYVRIFLVRTDTAFDGPGVAGGAVPIKLYDFYVEQSGYQDVGARCVEIDPKQDQDDPFTWTVTYNYSSKSRYPEMSRDWGKGGGSPGQGGDFADPLQRPPEIRFEFARFRRTVFAEYGGNVAGGPLTARTIQNSCGEPQPVEIDDSRPILTITKNFAGFDQSQVLKYKDGVNKNPWMGFAARTLKIANLQALSQFENNFFFWKCTLQVEIASETWDLYIVDQGYNQLDGNGNRIAITHQNTPAPLDGTGHLLVAGAALVKLPNDGNGGYQVYNVIDFSGLNFP